MNILVIGNGFDLAHELPTCYSDFLDFCIKVNLLFDDENVSEEALLKNFDGQFLNNFILTELIEALENRTRKYYDGSGYVISVPNDALKELNRLIGNNTWIRYFMKRRNNIGGNWIDFELEISKVIQSFDEAKEYFYHGNDDITYMPRAISNILLQILEASKWTLRNAYRNARAINKFSQFLYSELENLIRAIEIYIAEFVNCIDITKKSIDIDNFRPDHVLSFNYSSTYERTYDHDKKISYDYIHGKADAKKDIKSCNLVLGIDEYLSDDRKDKEVDFISFKKFYQRIYKGTGCQYRNWIDRIRKDRDDMHLLCIFGHSLDVTDKDILRDLILNDNVKTSIYYFSKDGQDKSDLSAKIINLVKIIGQDELIRRTGGSTKTIEFKMQQNMKKTIQS